MGVAKCAQRTHLVWVFFSCKVSPVRWLASLVTRFNQRLTARAKPARQSFQPFLYNLGGIFYANKPTVIAVLHARSWSTVELYVDKRNGFGVKNVWPRYAQASIQFETIGGYTKNAEHGGRVISHEEFKVKSTSCGAYSNHSRWRNIKAPPRARFVDLDIFEAQLLNAKSGSFYYHLVFVSVTRATPKQ